MPRLRIPTSSETRRRLPAFRLTSLPSSQDCPSILRRQGCCCVDRGGKVTAMIRSVSKARAKQLRLYAKELKVWRSDPVNRTCRFPGCQCCDVENHHTRGRVGRLLLDKQFWVPLCRRHHEWVGCNPGNARKLGLLAPYGRWNTNPDNNTFRSNDAMGVASANSGPCDKTGCLAPD